MNWKWRSSVRAKSHCKYTMQAWMSYPREGGNQRWSTKRLPLADRLPVSCFLFTSFRFISSKGGYPIDSTLSSSRTTTYNRRRWSPLADLNRTSQGLGNDPTYIQLFTRSGSPSGRGTPARPGRAFGSAPASAPPSSRSATVAGRLPKSSTRPKPTSGSCSV